MKKPIKSFSSILFLVFAHSSMATASEIEVSDYSSFLEAIQNESSEKKILITNGFEITDNIGVLNGTSITIDMQNHNINGNSGFNISVNQSLTLENFGSGSQGLYNFSQGD